MLSDQYVITQLTQSGLWGTQNLYFLAQVVKPAWQFALESVNTVATLLAKNTYAIINQTEQGIGILPLTIGISDITPMPHMGTFIPQQQITGVTIKKSFFSQKLILQSSTGNPSTFIVESKNKRITQHQQNYANFLAMYT